ncbi:MAG: hypothetical protein LBH31_09660, partial [Burkholderiaceae bacterium]|nr:hypothetical protein [Burkholderiaceae bacterium]
MSPTVIPIQPFSTGPGSQPAQPGDKDWACLPLPVEVQTYRAPPSPEPGERGADAVRQLLRGVVDAFGAGSEGKCLNLALDELDIHAHRLLAQLLGEGEVSARIALPDGGSVQI